MQGSDKRDGDRKNRMIDVVVTSGDGSPILANEIEINYGGMELNTSCAFELGDKVDVQLFVDREIRFEIKGIFIRRGDGNKTVIMFETLDGKNRLYLEQVLRDALLPRLAS